MCNVRYESRMCIIIFLLQIMILYTRTDDIPIYNIQHVGHIKKHPVITSLERINKHYCFLNNKWVKCSTVKIYNARNSLTTTVYEETVAPLHNSNRIRELNSNLKSLYTEAQPVHKRYYVTRFPVIHGRFSSGYPIQMHRPGYPTSMFQIPRPDMRLKTNNALSMPQVQSHAANGVVTPTPAHSPQVNSSSTVAYAPLKFKPAPTKGVPAAPQQQIILPKNMSSIDKFGETLDVFERQFYMITFTKLTTISPADRQENGMSFVQSGFFLLLTLMALSTEVDTTTKGEIQRCIGLHATDMEILSAVRHFVTMLPESSDKLKLRRSSRLTLWPGREVRPQFRANAASALMLHIDHFNGTETTEQIASILNHQVEMDSGGAIRDTFDEDDVSGGVSAAFITTLYVRGSWRTAPTVLNGSRLFHDHDNAPKRTVRMIRINDIMAYADLKEWDAQALEIYYATPGLSLLMLIPRGNSLRGLVQHLNTTSIGDVTAKMKKMRVAATVPLYTLRMTLLLPNKLQAMGIPSLVDVSDLKPGSPLRLSHAVQRIMFWAEAGRNAYKDDGIEWDQTPDIEVVADRPYIFFVRWRNLTLLNGNFVL